MRLPGARAPLFILLALACLPGLAKAASVFGSVTAIGGNASDIALDESRGVLYIANFGAHAIDVMSIGTNTISTSLNVLPSPGAIALSTDSQYLLVAHYCSVGTSVTESSCSNALTSIHLADGTQQVYSLANPPLGVAFLSNGNALVLTTANFLMFTPATGVIQTLAAISNVAQTVPVPFATFPGQIIQAELTASADGNTVWGIASAGTQSQLIFQYSGPANSIAATIYVTSPLLLPRISSSADGSYAAAGYSLLGPGGVLKGRYPNVIPSANITGVAIDSANKLVYAEYPDTNQSTGPGGTGQAAMLIMDADNLTFRDRISIPEDMVGRAVLNSAATVLYAVSESGVMILPVGSLNSDHRVAATQEDLLVSTNFCASGLLSRNLTILDPGGNATDFTLSTSQPGVTFLPTSGTTPATVQVLIDPLVFGGSGGTTAATINISSRSAVNQPKPVRLLMNNPDPSQLGAIVDQPGILSDILADPSRNRIYVLRQDMNQLLVYDGTSASLIGTIRTYTSPTMMAMTADRNFMLVGHDDSEYVGVYDLNSLQPLAPVVLPGGHFGRSIAVTSSAILALVRDEGTNPGGRIDSINLAGRTAAALTTLGAYQNGPPSSGATVSAMGILAASPSGANVFYAGSDGSVALYTAQAGTFVASRKDFLALYGAAAASDFGVYVVGNNVLDASLVPTGSVSGSPLESSGVTFVAQDAYSASTASPASAGSLAHVQVGPNAALPLAAPMSTTDAPLLSVGENFVWLGGYGTYGSGSANSHGFTTFSRTVAPLPNAGSIFMLTTSGLSVLNTVYPRQPAPAINAVISAADGSTSVAPGELVSIYGQNMSSLNLAAGSTPLTTSLGNSCIVVSGSPMPLLYVSPQQINAQLPFSAVGNTALTIHSPNGTSANYNLTIQPAAPSVFVTGSVMPGSNVALVVRDDNGQLVTPTNPLHPKDVITIFLTGMGQTSPAVAAGQVSPLKPLASALITPAVTLGTSNLTVGYAGLAPGEIGVYQINATVPSGVATGLSVPLTINQGGSATTLNVRVVN
jgi:uncharacterized protein (TIGR03437 family)